MDIEYYLKVKNPCQIKIHLMREMLEIENEIALDVWNSPWILLPITYTIQKSAAI